MRFSNELSHKLWLEEQLRLLWKFLEKENLDEEADQYVKENLTDEGYFEK